MYFSEGFIGGDIERVLIRWIKVFYEEDEFLLFNEYGDGLIYFDFNDEFRGFNGIVLVGDLMELGNVMLLINLYIFFYFWGEVYVVSEEGLNVYGVVIWG